MMLREEKSTSKAIAFEVLLPEKNNNIEIPEIAKRLESSQLNK